MKAIMHFPHVTVEVEGDTGKDLFDKLAEVSECLIEEECGKCGCDKIRPHKRSVADGKKTHVYYEWVCTKCRARLALGQHQTGGTLFPKRKLDENGNADMENGSFGEHNGWGKFNGNS